MTGPEVFAARLALGLSRRALARRLGYASETSLRDIERGRFALPADRAAWLEAAAAWARARDEWMAEHPMPLLQNVTFRKIQTHKTGA